MHWRRILVLAFLAAVGSGLPAQAQVRVDRPTGELTFDFDGSRFKFPTRPNESQRTFRQWLLFRTLISAVDPRIARLDVTLRPLFAQTSWWGALESPSGGIESLDGRLGLRLLSAQPVAIRAEVLRITQNNRGRYGTRIDSEIAEWNAGLDLKLRGLPSRLEYRDRSRDAFYFQTSGFTFREDQRTRTLRFQSSNSKMGLTLERLDFDDYIGPASFVHTRADFDHRFRWGKASNLASKFNFLDRDGSGAVRRVQWRQAARIQHTWKVRSELMYSLFDQTTRSDFSRGYMAQYMPWYELNRTTRVAVEGWAQGRSFSLGTQSYARIRPRINIGTALPAGLYLTVDVGAGYEWHDQQTSDTGVGTIVDERHVIDESGRFTLDETLVIPSTVVIRSPDGALLYQEGFDYRLVPAGPLLDVLTLPAGRLTAGTPVQVDYQYEILPGGSANSWIADWRVQLRVGPVELYTTRELQSEVGGDRDEVQFIPTLRDYDNQYTGFRFGARTPIGQLGLNAEYGRAAARFYDFTSVSAGGSLLFGISRSVTGSVAGRFSARRGGVAPLDLAQGEATVTWAMLPELRLMGRLAAFDWSEGRIRQEQFFGGGIGAEWTIHRLLLAVRFDRFEYTEGFIHNENRVMARISRAF